MLKPIKLRDKLVVCLAFVLCPMAIMAQCYVTGCNGTTCSSTQQVTFGKCVGDLNARCYAQFGVCEEDDNGNCNWRESIGLSQCINRQEQVVPETLNQLPQNQ